MYAIGKISGRKFRGLDIVTLFYNGQWQGWNLSNPEDVPSDWPDFGLFEFEPADQFCKWVDPSSLTPGNFMPVA